jgi:hypothetical protein
MKKIFFANLVAAAAMLFAAKGIALAEYVHVDLIKSPLALEMVHASGEAGVNLKKGVVRVRVKNFPENPETGTPEGSKVSDLSVTPPMAKEAQGFVCWLLRVELIGGKYIITDGKNLGSLSVNRNEGGKLKYDGDGMSDSGFNVIAVTAEENYDSLRWVPGDEFIYAFTWNGSPNGMIVMWGLLEPLS